MYVLLSPFPLSPLTLSFPSADESFGNESFLARELERKSYLKSLLSRTPQQIAEEDFLYVESRRLEQNYHKIVEERRELLKILGGRDGVGMNMSNNASNGMNAFGGIKTGQVGLQQQQVSKKKMTGWEFEGNGNGLPEGWAGEGSKRKATAAQGESFFKIGRAHV